MSASGSPSVAISQSSTATISPGIVGREHRVVEAVVAVDDRRRRRLRQRRRAGGARARRSPGARGSSTAPTARPSAAPGVRGSRRDGRSRRARPRRSRPRGSATSTSMSASEQRRASSAVSWRHLLRRAQDLPVDLLHHVEGRVVDVDVVAERERLRHRHVGGRERRRAPCTRAPCRARWAARGRAAAGAAPTRGRRRAIA